MMGKLKKLYRFMEMGEERMVAWVKGVKGAGLQNGAAPEERLLSVVEKQGIKPFLINFAYSKIAAFKKELMKYM